MKSFETRLVEAVRRKREGKGLSLRALSAVVGISFSTLARIERRDGVPDNNSKIRLLEWLGSDAEKAGLSFENVALVHFRAGKNARSSTVQALLTAAECIKKSRPLEASDARAGADDEDDEDDDHKPLSLSKEELERTAEQFRKDLKLAYSHALDSLKLDVEGIEIIRLRETNCLDAATVRRLSTEACDEWSAMSVPLNEIQDQWAVLLNDCHTPERQRVTLLEEVWHILLGHKLVKIAKVAESFGRTYDTVEEHDAYYLASATLLPRKAVAEAVEKRESSDDIASRFGTSPELVEYRIKRLGLWRDYIGKRVALTSM
ncbi:XRE family transcriptional regulator [Sphingomonas sp.]|jgi:transcriptional regulator with XRE-family HTH domain|uniref:helix-turn-helix domain-containing protein n=1 Tax=Sphingomonas sp. TaxID=28214 RepID=UPI001827D7DD|nr:XRE family transcriptional regulator [Sphingomonas sp.]MBA3511596.1 ImmA/IrrE family metallo-endopeptidase [Sphingomonas sp.]